MNKRQAWKKYKYEEQCEKIWGYVMSYSELRKEKRLHHEEIVQEYYRNSNDYSELEELSMILDISFEPQPKTYHYPNRARHRNREKVI